MLGLATMGSAVRVGVIQLARAAGIESLIAMIALGEPTAYAVMGALSARLPLPTAEYVVAAPQRLPAEDERVDVIFSAVLINLVRRLAPGLLAAALMSPGVCGAAEHGTGKVTAASGIAGAVALQPDGRIVVAGSSGTQTLLLSSSKRKRSQ